MSKKTFNLIVAVTGGVAAIASGVVAYMQPNYVVAIQSAIAIAQAAVVEICSLFKEKEK